MHNYAYWAFLVYLTFKQYTYGKVEPQTKITQTDSVATNEISSSGIQNKLLT